VSTRSPVFKERPLPKSKKEAIDLMMENSNLIPRPIMVKGSRVLFGFDKTKYEQLEVSSSSSQAELTVVLGCDCGG
jgi:arsenate reductase-like glutaredoxin family protein